ncbi:hypothetical protein K6U59_12540, partial [Vibrio vulnificus]|uniref:hypothetical protein n=1 Tax=Vibrio vulnificus TaxID=672 RepID=UPI001EEBC8BA
KKLVMQGCAGCESRKPNKALKRDSANAWHFWCGLGWVIRVFKAEAVAVALAAHLKGALCSQDGL